MNTRAPMRAPFMRRYAVQSGEPRNTAPEASRTMWAADMYCAHFISVQDRSDIRSSVSGGVRAPTSRVIAADTGIRQSANTMYAGTRSALMTTTCSIESDGAEVMPARHKRTAGNMAMPQTTVWTVMIATDVTTMRKIFIAAHHNDGES